MRVRSAVLAAILGCTVVARFPFNVLADREGTPLDPPSPRHGFGAAGAQVRPVYDLGASGLTQLLERLTTTASALHTGAHPDDEDSAFIARTARGDHARVAYLSLNRGEGGQNIIGTELFDALGVIRTEELLQARRLDGGEQFFTRAFDFGFSKTLSETSSRWNEREVLRDMVRIIRMFRPLVIYSRFAGTSADGHGHHQMAGYLTPLAFKASADPNEFPDLAQEGLRPWQARKLYRNAGGRAEGQGTDILEVGTGAVHPVLGRSYAEIAAEGRSQHKSQEMGSIEPRGPAFSALRLIDPLVTTPSPERSIFDGIDVTVPGLAALSGLPPGTLRTELSEIQAAASQALRSYEPLDPSGIIPVLASGLRATRAARTTIASMARSNATADADFLLARKEDEFSAALTRAAGVIVDPLANDETLQPGGTIGVTIRTFAEDANLARVVSATVRAPEGWTVASAGDSARSSNSPAGRREVPTHSAAYLVTAPANAPPTQPYFLAAPRTGDVYRWPDAAPKGLPFAPSLLTGVVELDIAGNRVTSLQPVQYRYADPVRGELRRDVNVVPALIVALDSPLFIVPTGSAARSQRVVARATSFSVRPMTGVIRLRIPPGWTVTPDQSPFSVAAKGDSASATFMVTAPARRAPGRQEIAAEAFSGASFVSSMQTIAYPHIQTHRLYTPAVAAAQVFDLKVAAVHVGYIMGSGDQVPDALRRMGVDVAVLDDETIASGELSGFDTIVVGVRATEARPAFVAHQSRLRQFMERGGTLIVQYQQQEYASRNLPPYPAEAASNSRVTDETARVRILAPAHPVFTFPNRITAADFDGWVQERNLYAFTGFDAKYTPLLECADPGEQPQRGGELHAAVGKGHYVYTAYSWFRQLPAGVPGAYRQFANLISLPRAPK